MLIILCLIFPPAIPFVLLYYLFRGVGKSKQQVKIAKRQTALTEDLIMATVAPEEFKQELLRRKNVLLRSKAWTSARALAFWAAAFLIVIWFATHGG